MIIQYIESKATSDRAGRKSIAIMRIDTAEQSGGIRAGRWATSAKAVVMKLFVRGGSIRHVLFFPSVTAHHKYLYDGADDPTGERNGWIADPTVVSGILGYYFPSTGKIEFSADNLRLIGLAGYILAVQMLADAMLAMKKMRIPPPGVSSGPAGWISVKLDTYWIGPERWQTRQIIRGRESERTRR